MSIHSTLIENNISGRHIKNLHIDFNYKLMESNSSEFEQNVLKVKVIPFSSISMKERKHNLRTK